MQPISIEHFSRRKEFIQMLKERGTKNGVEIGTDHGKYAQQLCEGIPGLMLSCVDPWTPYTEGLEVHDQENIDKIYEEAQERLKPYSCNILKVTSMEAVTTFGDDSLDFIFIDGNHDYLNVTQDLNYWYRKVKPGGIIAGHDYKEDKINNYGVIEAVNEFTQQNKICPWFVFKGGGRLVPCWMIIK